MIVAALLRLQFHDCFVRGCDASILLDGSNSEKTAPINLHLRGFDIVDAAKAAVEAVCPGVVSCADIIVMATRDSVAKSKGVRYDVQTGRRDGFISLAQNTVDIPTPNISVSDSIKAFDKKGLGFVDMVYLLGAHTVGVAHCSTFIDRLYNFKNTGKPDPSMNDELLTKLRSTCPRNATVDNIANLDQNPRTSIIVDNSYYYQILKHRGVLQIDQELVNDLRTVLVVLGATLELDFNIRFPHAMVNLGKVQVLTGTEGEIRKSCPAVNNPTAMAI
ncbi:Peroxidase 60 [Camellia lanceoleosa]|uniref:Peroxidase 60 n=1 Tax=Camellia lanceoleosa TaxID=1840588 RepID=A0ACC0FR30_9ERIC|nr:Peroxidase 60 [Camellia lanceoleosa]